MDGLKEWQGGGLARIEPVQDPEVNRALFTMYSNLIEPLAQIERTHGEIIETEETIARTEHGTKISMSAVLEKAIKPSIILAIVLFVIQFIMASCIEAFGDLRTVTALIISTVGGLILSLIGAYCVEASHHSAREKRRKKIHEEAVETLVKLEDSLKWQVGRIREVIMFVPPKYRFSEALRYFVESYSNSRVDNLKEAVNAFDTYYFRSQSLQTQNAILQKLDENNELLGMVAYNQLCMMGQLNGIQRDIWLSGGIFS